MSDPIQPEYHAQMNALAGVLDETFNGPAPAPPRQRVRKVGFVLLTFEFGKTEGGRVNYISNGERETTLAAMRETLARLEGRHVDAPAQARQ